MLKSNAILEDVEILDDCRSCMHQGACQVEILRKHLDAGVEEATRLGLTRKDTLNLILLWLAEELARQKA